MDLEKLREQIEVAVKNAFLIIIEKEKDIYSFALYSDENCETLSVESNTLEYLKKAKIDNEEEDSDHYSKYSLEEWDYSITKDINTFSDINKLLKEHFNLISFENKKEEKIFLKFQTSFYDVCVEVLSKLKSEGFFKEKLGKEIFITFGVTEYEFESSKQREIVKTLNDNKYAEEYLNWMNTL
ncbi:DUF4303 domain-containing protein [Cellulophaga algicola]|uniref:DUF4303 domain-containing protein n=1 Tax=Cellulophaga algicola TaxID=59600 RepID=UPI00145F87F8|nr:DUF4303 domain-containing protein [Cellulophaga algicola]